MKILVAALVTFSVFISAIQCDSNEDSSRSSSESQKSSTNLVNITSAQLHYLNTDYVNKKTYKAGLERKNDTYTELPLQWDIIKDFPEDTVLITKFVKSKSENGPWENVQTYVSKICNLKDKYHDYLPPFLIELTKDGKCIQKGKHHFNDAGQFQFDRLFPASFLEGWYFNTYNQIRSFNPEALIKDIEIKSKSVNAK
ncbi:uncharacterized protein LOC131672961 [Phymastichus coffea]|uniref:uncharacterized protein LOC131672961 n=1 Tax=Phymastichus coffea TaxID=108790 RepID=UPI00273A9E83|nr:uncharacterized protein LOC131672961 [Phymastichus coffea]